MKLIQIEDAIKVFQEGSKNLYEYYVYTAATLQGSEARTDDAEEGEDAVLAGTGGKLFNESETGDEGGCAITLFGSSRSGRDGGGRSGGGSCNPNPKIEFSSASNWSSGKLLPCSPAHDDLSTVSMS